MKNRQIAAHSWLRQYIVDLIILVMVWGGYYRCVLSNSDSLWGELSPDSTLAGRLINFRWLGYVLDRISFSLGYYPFEHQKLSLGLFLLVMAAALVLMQRTFTIVLRERLQTDKDKAIYIVITALCYVNVLIAEMFYFTEAYLNFKSALFLAMLGCYLYSRRHYAIGSISIFAASMFYQVTMVQAAIVLCTLAFLEEKGEFSLRLVRKELVYILVPMGAGVLNLLSGAYVLSLFGQALDESYDVAKYVVDIRKTFVPEFRTEMVSLYESGLGLMIPVFLPLLFSLVMTVAVLVAIHRNGKVLLSYVIYKVVAFGLVLCLQILEDPREFIPRMVWVFFVMQSMNALLALYYTDHARLRRGLQYIGVGYVLANAFFIQVIIANRVLSENLDLIYVNKVIDYILAYEEETGEEITNIAFRNDAHAENYYEQVYFCKNAINRRGYLEHAYSIVEIVARDRDLSFEWSDMDEAIYAAQFEGRDWNDLNLEEQTYVQDGTMYICIF